MPAYLISVDPKDGYAGDPEGMQRYSEVVPPMVVAFGGTYLSPHLEAQVLEGGWDPDYIVLVEFPSKDRLLEFYESDEYRPWRELRQKAGDASIVIVAR